MSSSGAGHERPAHVLFTASRIIAVARVNVDSQALTDARFAVLAKFMGVADPDFALGKMVRLWMQCLERETYVLNGAVIEAIFGNRHENLRRLGAETDTATSPVETDKLSAADMLVSAELAERTEGGFRIKGTQGRIEYLAEQRARARLNGVKGGRPQKPTSVVGNNPRRGGEITPPAPAPAPALKEETPLPPELDTDAFRQSWKAWQNHRREIRKPLRPTMVSRQLKTLAAMGHDRAVKCIEHTIEKGWTGLREPEQSGPLSNGKPSLDELNARMAAKYGSGKAVTHE